MDGFVRDDGAERLGVEQEMEVEVSGLAPLGVEGMEPVGWRRVDGEEAEDSRRGAEPQREEEEGLRGDRVGALLGEVFGGAAGRVGLEQEVVVMGAARKIELGRRVKLLEVLREVEEGVLVSASKEKPVPNVVSALRIAVDLDAAESMGDRVDLRRVAVHMAVEAIRIAGELGEREKGGVVSGR